MNRVLVDMERIRNPYSGLGQFCSHFGNSLLSVNDEEINWEFLVKSTQKHWGNGLAYRKLHWWNKWFPVQTDAKVWHCTHQDSPYWPMDRNKKVVFTIHDLNFLEREDYPGWKKKQKLNRLQSKLNQADVVVCISNFVKQQVELHLQIPEEQKCCVVYNGNNQIDNLVALGRREWEGLKPFLFSIGIHPKKNYHALLPILKNQVQYCWVIAGENSRGYREKIEKIATEMGCADRLVFAGPVSEGEKKWLFEHCEALLFPSKSEGFGLPVVEAMSLGKPVFLSNKTSLPEVGGKEAYYFLNDNEVHLQDVFRAGMADFKKDQKKAERLKQWAAQFNWENTAREYIKIYKRLMNQV